VSERYALIDGEKAHFPLAMMCRVLEVSRSGYYAWRARPASATLERRRDLQVEIYEIFYAVGRMRYGYRRVHRMLARRGIEAGPELVRALMRELGLVPLQPRPWRRTTIADPDAAATPDLVARSFTAEQVGRVMVGDITYVRTWEGWVYLATVIDCASRMVLGHATADHMRASLVIDALAMAARNHRIPPGAVFHSDRGSQYTSAEYRSVLTRHGIAPSMGKRGVCWDNAMAESFNAIIKNELIYPTEYQTRRHAERDIAAYIELFYNCQRIHSGLGYATPLEAYREKQANVTLAA
jgi:transposase InsO family protein